MGKGGKYIGIINGDKRGEENAFKKRGEEDYPLYTSRRNNLDKKWKLFV